MEAAPKGGGLRNRRPALGRRRRTPLSSFHARGGPMTERAVFTPEAVALVAALKASHGPLIFHLSGGCCEGSAPMCFRQSDFRVGASDVLLGAVDGCPFYVGVAQFDYWSGCQIIIDVTTDGG